MEKIVALYTSGTGPSPSAGWTHARRRRRRPGLAELLARHEATWGILWRRFDVQLDSANEWAETILHLHIFHLLQTVSPHEHLDVGVPARGWHGEAYRGHIFWDELFIFPFFNLQQPRVAAALLDYRARLGAARQRPGRPDMRAMFPWQSGSNGREETQQLHLNPESPGVGCPTTLICSATSTSPLPTTSGSTT